MGVFVGLGAVIHLFALSQAIASEIQNIVASLTPQEAETFSALEEPLRTDEVTQAANPTADGSVSVSDSKEALTIDDVNSIGDFTLDGREDDINDATLEQIINVSQLRDVKPTDWAYEALRSLVERYNCIAGYPDSTFRGKRSLTRYEFAAGVNACLRQIERLISTTGDGVTQKDLETLRRLAQEFQAEIASLGTRIDKLEGRVAILEGR